MKETCFWKKSSSEWDQYDDIIPFITDCENKYHPNKHGDIDANGFKYCPYCGRLKNEKSK